MMERIIDEAKNMVKTAKLGDDEGYKLCLKKIIEYTEKIEARNQ